MNVKSLNDLEIYQLAMRMSEDAWGIYDRLPNHLKYNIGHQFIKAIDSVGANIAEGFGRFFYADKRRFFYYSRGSLYESKHWLKLLLQRALISKEEYSNISQLQNNLGVKLNNLITSLNKKIQKQLKKN